MSCVDLILPHHNPNEGREIINSNFDILCGLAFSGVTGHTIVSGGTNISVVQIGSSPLEYLVSLSGDVAVNSFSANSISADTYYSGSTDVSLLFAPINSIGSGIRNFITSGVSVTVAQDFQYLVYGDLTIYSGGTLTNNGQVVIINGALSLSGGSFVNNASLLMVDLALNNAGKYSANFSIPAFTGGTLNINHSLNTQNFVYMTRQGTSEISVQLTIVDNNNVTITTMSAVPTGRITIIGV